MNIFETMNAVMSEIGAVGKTSKNTTQGFMFRGIDAVMNAIAPALQKYKLFIVPEVLEQNREERTNSKGTTLIFSICKIKYTFYAEDGTYVTATVIGEGMDTGDKATNKAMSVAFKYALFQAFCIPTEEMRDADPDLESHEVTGDKKKPAEPKKVEPKKAEPIVEIIGDAESAALAQRCQKDGIPVELICEWYKVKNLSELNKTQFAQLNTNWDAAKDAAEKRRAV